MTGSSVAWDWNGRCARAADLATPTHDRHGRKNSHVGPPEKTPVPLSYPPVSGGRVNDAKYQTHGCGATIAAGSMLTEMVKGCSIEECLALTRDQLAEALGGVPVDKQHCPALAIAALDDALKHHSPAPSGGSPSE